MPSDEIMIASGEQIVNVDKYFSPSEESVSLYIPNGEEGLTTLSADLTERIVPVSVKTAEGAFNLTFPSLKGLKEGYQVVLEDKLTKSFREVAEGASYSFYSQGGNAARFALHIQQSGAETVENSALVYGNGNQLEIRLNAASDNNEVMVRDLSGRMVQQFSFEGGSASQAMNLPNGVYAVTIKNNGFVKTQKVLFGNN
jgi:hypothetical protein